MISESQINDVIGGDVYGADGSKIGRAGQVYLDDETGRPEWVTVRTGLFGTNETFVPLSDAEVSGGRVTVPYAQEQVKDAPNVNPDGGHLSVDDEEQLYRHYGLTYSRRDSDTGLAPGRDADIVDRDSKRRDVERSGRSTDDAMTRSEERLNVGTETREAGRARLRKYVVTEQQTVAVPVTREEVRVEREPVTDANRGTALEGPDISEAEHEVTLHEERPVVEKEAVPVERVRLAKDQVTEQREVTEEVRKEQIETEGLDETDVDRRE